MHAWTCGCATKPHITAAAAAVRPGAAAAPAAAAQRGCSCSCYCCSSGSAARCCSSACCLHAQTPPLLEEGQALAQHCVPFLIEVPSCRSHEHCGFKQVNYRPSSRKASDLLSVSRTSLALLPGKGASLQQQKQQQQQQEQRQQGWLKEQGTKETCTSHCTHSPGMQTCVGHNSLCGILSTHRNHPLLLAQPCKQVSMLAEPCPDAPYPITPLTLAGHIP
jgi:hypothetical protein